MCRQCESHVTVSEKQLESHIDKKHLVKRSTSNHDIVTKLLFKPVESHQKNHWREGIAFLRTHPFKPATFRQTLITLIKFRLEDDVLHAFFQVLQCCVVSSKKSSQVKLNGTVDYDPTDRFPSQLTQNGPRIRFPEIPASFHHMQELA